MRQPKTKTNNALMTLNRLFLLAVLLLAISGCAIQSGNLQPLAKPDPSYRTERTVFTFARNTRILGIGGMQSRALVAEARQKLREWHPLGPDEIYGDITIDIERSFWPFIDQTRVVLSAEIRCPADGREYQGELDGFWYTQYNTTRRLRAASLAEVKDGLCLIHYFNQKGNVRRKWVEGKEFFLRIIGVPEVKEVKAFRYFDKYGLETAYSGPVEIFARNSTSVLLRIANGEQRDEGLVIRSSEAELAKFAL